MLKELFSYFKEHNRPEIVEVNGKNYSTRSLERLALEEFVMPIEARSLTGLVDYIRSNFDTVRPFMVHVQSPTKVVVQDALNEDNDRRTYIEANALLPRIQFDHFMDIENFVIQTQANFIQDDHARALLKFVGSISEEDSRETVDNGIGQKVVAKSGVATKEEVDVPNPVYLRPFRTFVEVAQPTSSFVLRIKSGPRAALFQADGGAWELSAMASIKEYLEKELAAEIENKKVIIVS